jgi:hypothetical protein
METNVIKFTNFHLHLSFKLAPYGHYILVYDTCSTHWIFVSLAEGQMWHLSGFTGRITSSLLLPGTGFCRMGPIEISSSLVIFSHANQRFISTITRSKPRSNKKEKRSAFFPHVSENFRQYLRSLGRYNTYTQKTAMSQRRVRRIFE